MWLECSSSVNGTIISKWIRTSDVKSFSIAEGNKTTPFTGFAILANLYSDSMTVVVEDGFASEQSARAALIDCLKDTVRGNAESY